MIRLALIFAMLPVAANADVLTPQGRTVDCYCTDTDGARIELGETICLTVSGRMFMAQCQMSLNVPMWRETQEGCLQSRLISPVDAAGAHRTDQPVQTFAIHPEV
ncbi:hypothetical protein OS189_06920 [Sulfitobacter sp. F26169L]|uniref:hypothetical protein n=1 Tax=Sulfitobacter sp. F26169L TaxID=2996015 RepID=UPI002260B5B8|nr:hypothetical protein [Sulfitobacter sp. F26169L]MCX7566069.1 hypothetical protein [Sulfitobacter sp. F26169L]